MRATSPLVRVSYAGRRVQTAVIGLVVLAATAACPLALGLLVDSTPPSTTPSPPSTARR